jgi:hypothetical protein
MRFVAWATEPDCASAKPPPVWAVLALALLLAWSAVAQAQPPLPEAGAPCAPEVMTRSALLTHAGQQGMWFHIDVARCMLARLEALPLYAERVRLLEQRLTLSDERHELMLRQVALAEEGERRAEQVLLNAERASRRASEEAGLERNLRWLWFAAGIVLTVAVQAVAIWALGELR